MFNELTISQAQAQLPNLPESLQHEPTVITKDGSPVLIAFNIEFFSLVETAEILADDSLMASLRLSEKQIDEGKYSDMATIKSELGL